MSSLPAWHAVLGSWDGRLFTAGLVLLYPAWAYALHRVLKDLKAVAPRPVKLRFYAAVIVSEWLVVGGMLFVAGRHGLSASDLGDGLGIAAPTLVFTAVLLAAVVAVTIFKVRQIRRASPERLAKQVRKARSYTPNGPVELAAFALVAITAGVCEELLYRGWIVNLATAASRSMVAGVLIGGIVFGTAHAYQGVKGMLHAGTMGMVFGVVFVLTKSLVPIQVMHAGIDLATGTLGAAALARGSHARRRT